MKKLFEVYTNTGELDEESVKQFIEETKQVKDCNFEQIARYVYQDDNGKNILVECDIPTGNIKDNYIFITAYEFEGELEDYQAEIEITSEEFNGDWNSLEAFMRDMAETTIR